MTDEYETLIPQGFRATSELAESSLSSVTVEPRIEFERRRDHAVLMPLKGPKDDTTRRIWLLW